jgi:hypothetical protein
MALTRPVVPPDGSFLSGIMSIEIARVICPSHRRHAGVRLDCG